MALKHRLGIRARLFLAFLAVSSMAVIESTYGWLSYSDLGNTLQEFELQHLPALGLAAQLAEEGGAVIAMAPILATAHSQDDYSAATSALQQRLDAMRRLLAVSRRNGFEPAQTAQLEAQVNAIASNLGRLDENVRTQFALGRRVDEATEQLRWLQADFLDEVQPLVDDARFNIGAALRKAEDAGDHNAIHPELDVLRKESGKSEAVLQASASGSLAAGLIARAATMSTTEALDDNANFLGETLYQLDQESKALKNWPESITLRQVITRLLVLGSGDKSLPELRRKELIVRQQGLSLLAENRELVARLNKLIAARIGAVQERADTAAQASAHSISRARKTLSAVAILSLILAVLVTWFYVNRNLILRLTALAKSAKEIAAGNLQAAIPLNGNDEIAEMAKALIIFRDTAVQVEEENAQAIIDNADAGLVTTDEHGIVEFVNPLASELIGAPKRTSSPLHLVDLLGPDCRAEIEAFLARADFQAEHTEMLALKTTARRPDRNTVPITVAIRAFRRRQRHRFIVTITDMTERLQAQQHLERAVSERTADLRLTNARLLGEIADRRQKERELHAAQDELIQAAKLAALGQLTAGIGHELNQPLAAIKSYAHNGRILLERDKPAEADSNLGKILELVVRMTDITNQLKRFARRPSRQIASVDVAATIRSALSLFGNQFRESRIEIVLNLPTAGIAVAAEEVRLVQVFVNLISNALDAVAAQKTRRIAIKAETETANQKEQVRILISDTGCGIPADKLQSIFDPFYTSKPPGQGLGLGLSISYNIIRDFAGTLAVAASDANGSTFAITLNRAQQSS
jgi:two-component system phosphoglycerate transport system sensor histidine kinase PgtB